MSEEHEEDKSNWKSGYHYMLNHNEHSQIQKLNCPVDRRNWTVEQWTDYAKAGNKDLRGAELESAWLEEIDLRGADLTGAFLGGAILEGADLRGAILDDTALECADLRRANLEGHDINDLRKRVAGF